MSSRVATPPSLLLLDEPRLEFRYAQRMEDPRDGLSVFGPYDADKARPSLSHAIVGPSDGLDRFAAWSAAMKTPHMNAPKGRTRLWPPFPGFEAAFAVPWHDQSTWTQPLDRETLLTASRHNDPNQRAYDVVNLYLKAFEASSKLDDPIGVVVCVVPDEVYSGMSRGLLI